MRTKKGFTLIELMIVIAIIAIIAAIAIPGLLAAQRSANQRNASASLKTIPTAEADFRSNDRDGDRLNNFWVSSLYGLYGICPSTDGVAAGSALPGDMVKVIDSGVASSDSVALVAPGTLPVGIVAPTAALGPSRSPKSGYFFSMGGTDELTVAYPEAIVGGSPIYNGHHNFGKFACMAVPVARGTGTQMFLVTEDATIYRFELPALYSAQVNTAWGSAGLGTFNAFATGTGAGATTWSATYPAFTMPNLVAGGTISLAGGTKMD